MVRMRDKMLPDDITSFAQEYPDHSGAVRAARLIGKCVHNSKIHVRKNKVVVKTQFSADSWFLTFATLMITLKQNNIEPPNWIDKYVSECHVFSQKHKTWYMKSYPNGDRVGCKDFLNKFGILVLEKTKQKQAI